MTLKNIKSNITNYDCNDLACSANEYESIITNTGESISGINLISRDGALTDEFSLHILTCVSAGT